ncbi:HlyD family secretion protein [Methylocella sp.]|uniref:HlyD family secretion protein n=1 Tax=Methylocella sp. TaxID=1978226 RepID=UPI003784D5C8
MDEGGDLGVRARIGEAPSPADPQEDLQKSRQDDPPAAAQEPEAPDEDAAAAPPKKKRSVVRVLALLAAIGAAGGGYVYLSTRGLVSTDDAFTDGRAVTIAPQVSGEVVALEINDNEFVRKGDVLLRIDPRRYVEERDQAKAELDVARAQYQAQELGVEIARKNFPAQLDQAKAQLLAAQALVAKTEADYQRQKSLPRQATTQQEVDAATAALRQAQAQVKLAEAQVAEAMPAPQRVAQADADARRLDGQVRQAEAKLAQAELNLGWTEIRAPQDGWITKRNVEVGDYATPGQSLFALVAPEVWVTANFKETQLDRIRPGQSVDISVDAYPSLKLKGRVNSVQLGSGSKFTAFPPENATGNFVKIVQRVPVKITIESGLDPQLPLPLGVSVTPTVKVE